jgi:glucose 1-dehydrogenase
MKAIVLTPGTTNARLADRPEPVISASDEVKLKVLRVGICGTDREEIAGGRADAPPGSNELVIGHEMFGQVVETGAAVDSVKPGDFGVFMVRRGCGHCLPCNLNRSDMCESGDYTERGIRFRDGYDCEFVVDQASYLVRLPPDLSGIGVLTEPMSVAEKAIDAALRIQIGRMPSVRDPAAWLRGRRVLVAGLGPVGLLAAFALRLRGANVIGMDIVDSNTSRPVLLGAIGGVYVDARKTGVGELRRQFPQIELIFEATGVATIEFDLLEALGINGVYAITGIPGGDRPMTIHGGDLIRRLVLRNQVMVGSVNESLAHFNMAVDDLGAAKKQWGEAIDRVITHHFPYTAFNEALRNHRPDEIKAVLEW